MIARRNGDEVQDSSIAGSDNATAAAYAFRGMPPAPHLDTKAERDDKVSMFWRVFGGTILSIIALAAVTIYNNIAGSVSELRTELNRVNAELRTEITRSNEARAELIRKDEFTARMATVWDGIKTMQASAIANTTAVTMARTEQESLKDRLTRSIADLDSFRKDSTTAADAMKKELSVTSDGMRKDIAALEALRERLMQLSVEFKAQRDDTAKFRADLDRNIAYDNERKLFRDTQAKQYDDLFKELQKAVQDCREKLARLEGQANPMPTAPAPMPKKP